MPIPQEAVVLTKTIDGLRRPGDEQLSGCSQECVPAVEKQLSDTVIEVQRTGVETLRFGIIIKVPAHAGGRAGINVQARDHRRKAARSGQECYSREVGRGGEDVASAADQ